MTADPFANQGAPQQTTQGGGGYVDPLGGAQTPAVSFKEAPVGAYVSLRITEPGTQQQQRDFDTGEPDFWVNSDGTKGNPKMAAVYVGVVTADTTGRNPVGEERSLWAPLSRQPGSMAQALREAQQAAGAGVGVNGGGTLSIRFESTEPNKDRKKNDRKLYKAVYQPDGPLGAPQQTEQAAPEPAPQAAPQQALAQQQQAAQAANDDPFAAGGQDSGPAPF